MFPGNVRLIDLSVSIEHEAVSEPMPARIRYITHDGEGLEQMRQFFDIGPEDLVYSRGLGWAIEEITAITHTGTHVDAPYHIHSKEYFRQPGLGRDEVLWLVERGVRVIGIDAYTLDRPFADMVSDYKRTGDGRHIWPAHFAGIEAEYCQIEKLANLDRIPVDHGFWISCFPVKIAGASAGWCRAVAIVPEPDGTDTTTKPDKTGGKTS